MKSLKRIFTLTEEGSQEVHGSFWYINKYNITPTLHMSDF
jgi:hypothetical protein